MFTIKRATYTIKGDDSCKFVFFQSGVRQFSTVSQISLFNFIPNNNIVYQSKLKEFADGFIIVTQKYEFVLGRV